MRPGGACGGFSTPEKILLKPGEILCAKQQLKARSSLSSSSSPMKKRWSAAATSRARCRRQRRAGDCAASCCRCPRRPSRCGGGRRGRRRHLKFPPPFGTRRVAGFGFCIFTRAGASRPGNSWGERTHPRVVFPRGSHTRPGGICAGASSPVAPSNRRCQWARGGAHTLHRRPHRPRAYPFQGQRRLRRRRASRPPSIGTPRVTR